MLTQIFRNSFLLRLFFVQFISLKQPFILFKVKLWSRILFSRSLQTLQTVKYQVFVFSTWEPLPVITLPYRLSLQYYCKSWLNACAGYHREIVKTILKLPELFIWFCDSFASRRGYRMYVSWNEYHFREKNIYFRTFQKQDTKSKFFEMETEFESRWQTTIPTLRVFRSGAFRSSSRATQEFPRNIFLLISFSTHEK